MSTLTQPVLVSQVIHSIVVFRCLGEFTSNEFSILGTADLHSVCSRMTAVDCGLELTGYQGFNGHPLHCGRKIFEGYLLF